MSQSKANLSVVSTLRTDRNKTTGNDGGDGMSLEPRVAKLESDIKHIQTDIGEIKIDLRALRDKIDKQFLILGGMVISAFLILATILATGFFRLSDRVDAESAKTEGSLKQILERLPARKP